MNERTASNRVALSVVMAVFFMWGFITVLNDVLIPHLKALFTLNYAQAMLVQFIFFGAYFVMSLPSGRVVERFGYRSSIVIGLAGDRRRARSLFVPAARLVSYGVFLGAFFVLASGITLLQVAANPYVSLLGDARQASARLTLAQALNSLGTMLAPLFGGMLILAASAAPARRLDVRGVPHRAGALVTPPYLAIAAALFVLAFLVRAFSLPALREAKDADARARVRRACCAIAHVRARRRRDLRLRRRRGRDRQLHDQLPVACPHRRLSRSAMPPDYVSLYWGGAMVGRFAGSALMRAFDPRALLALPAAIAAAARR